jgi:DNA-binding transcriptional LysR family regulator
MPDLRQLRAFLAVAEQLSFTRAAEQLHLQQQTVSKTIRQLEAELGVELLERTTREVHLTPAGRVLADSGPAVLAAADAAFTQARQVGTGSAGRIRVGVTPAIATRDRQDVIAAIRDRDGGASVAFYESRPTEIAHQLRERDLDIALVRSSAKTAEGVHRVELRPTPAVICLPPTHRLANRPSLALTDLRDERLLLPSPPGTPFTDMVLAQFAKADVEVTPVESRVTGGASILNELERTGTVGLRPESTELPPGILAIPVPALRLPLWLLWPAGLPSPAVHRLREAMAEDKAGLGGQER